MGFSYRLADGDRVSVYPVFESFDISCLSRVREHPLRVPRFVLDVHLGRLARRLRLLGFDTIYRNDLSDDEIARMVREGRRIVLTRDTGLLKRKAVRRGYWVRSLDPKKQLREVVERFQLKGQARPFRLCLRCNGVLERVSPETVRDEVGAAIFRFHRRFWRCSRCGAVYWRGTHYRRMERFVQRFLRGEAWDD